MGGGEAGLHQGGDAGHPHAIGGGVGLGKAVALQDGHRGGQVLAGVGDILHRQSLLVLDADGGGVFGAILGGVLGEGRGGGGSVEAVGLGIQGSGGLIRPGAAQAQEGVYGVSGLPVLLRGCLGLTGADTEQVVAVAEEAVVGPVGGGHAHAHHGDVVHQEHDDRENGQAQPAVGDHLVDLIRGGEDAPALLFVAGLQQGGDVHIALVGDDALRVVVQLLLRGLYVRLDMGEGGAVDLQLLQDLVVPLENLDGVPALLLLGQAVDRRLLDVGDGVLHHAGEGVHGHGPAVFSGVDGRLGGLLDAGALEGGDLHDGAAQLPGKLFRVDAVPVFPHHVHHIDGDDHRDAQLGELGGEVQVALQVGAVHDVQDGVGALAHQVIPGHHLL